MAACYMVVAVDPL